MAAEIDADWSMAARESAQYGVGSGRLVGNNIGTELIMD